MPKRIYITTTLPYVNAEPHLGFALELVQADIIARYKKLMGEEVFFNIGTDEHGQKIWQKAKAAGREVQEYVDDYAGRYRELLKILNISNDVFIRTTSPNHIKAAQELWRRCERDIYKKKFKGLYCVGHEAFIKEADLIDGKCPDHQTVPETVEEENYFFKFSNYQKQLLKYLEQIDVAIPITRKVEAELFVKNGLEDFSISRLKSKMPWGIPVPGDDEQVMYVWFDALTNYISTLGWPEENGNFNKFWQAGETIQFAGKDQVRFQSLMWQAMLMAAGIKNTDTVFYHGFINVAGQKMSKSIGNVVSPVDLVDEYGTDAVRYYLARHVNPSEDSDFTLAKFKEAYNAGLANGLGNLVSRVMKMASDYLNEPVNINEIKKMDEVGSFIEKFEFNRAMNSIWSYIADLDGMIHEKKPFEIVKTDKARARKQITHLVKELARIADSLQPFMPETSNTILEAIKSNKKPENLFPRKD